MPVPTLLAHMTVPGRVAFEGPGRNGAREKIFECDLHDLPPAIVAALIDQRDRIAAAAADAAKIEEREALARKRAFYARTLHDHGPALAAHVVPEIAQSYTYGRRSPPLPMARAEDLDI